MIEGELYWTGDNGFPTGIFLALLIGTGACGLFGAWALKRMREPDDEEKDPEETGSEERGVEQ